ncbi:MAG TPA: hypothetical protein VKR56_02995, partial [Candidatus Cybelea sp.]|nr:hypothetical protein [Candidatus Cybelea sp.]
MFSGLERCALVLAIAVLVFAGCGVSAEQAGPFAASQSSRSHALLYSLLSRLESGPVHADHAASWMAPTSKTKNQNL